MEIDLRDVWFVLVGAIFAGYAMLDGFDLGVGALHLFARGDRERRVLLNAIGPVWDGNEVWLVVGGGALFAAFPNVYATVFSGFYLAIILLLFALIFRAVAIEFRDQRTSHRWRQTWDVLFSLASIGAALLFGIALGNVVRGIQLDAAGNYTGSTLDLINPYALLTGVTTLALFAMHGAVFLQLRTDGDLQRRTRAWARIGLALFVVCYLALVIATLSSVAHVTNHIKERPWLILVAIVTALAIANVPREMARNRAFAAFVSSCLAVLGPWLLVGLSMYPDLVVGKPVERSLTVDNASSSHKTLQVMLIMAGIGMPLVIAYTLAIYRLFLGKVRLDAQSY